MEAALAPDTVREVEVALSDLIRLFNRPTVQHHLMAEAGVAIEIGPYWALRRLADLGACRPSDLAAALGVDASTVTHRLQALERSGFVERVTDPADGRACIVRLSPDGTAALARLRAARRGLFERLLAGWEDHERGALAAGIARVRAALADELRVS